MKRYRVAAIPSLLRGSLFSFCVLFQNKFFNEGFMAPLGVTGSVIEIEAITGREKAAGEFLLATLGKLAASTGGKVERMEISFERFNVLATWGQPIVTLSTHMDTVPPFFPPSEDDEFVRGRGACDAKVIIATMLFAAAPLLLSAPRDFVLVPLI